MIDFWGLIIGLQLFGFYVYKLYPVAFVLTILGMNLHIPSYVRIGHVLRYSQEC